MLSVKIRRVFLAGHRVDFRRRFDGLLTEALQLGANPYDGDCVLFVKCCGDSWLMGLRAGWLMTVALGCTRDRGGWPS